MDLVEIKKSIATSVWAGAKKEVRHTKRSRALRRMPADALAAENTARAKVGLPPHQINGTLKQRLATITG
jgi:hypothetical protein